MRTSLAIIFLLAASAFAQNAIYVFPPSPRTPAGGVQSVTAVVTGNANKKVNWSTTCGTLVGSGNTMGLKSSSAATCTLTATMAADAAKSASSAVTFEPIRPDLQAAGIHPRIGLTPADVADLQKKIDNPGNAAYTVGLQTYFNNIKTYYNAHFCWAGGRCDAVGPIGTLNSSGWIDNNNNFAANGGGEFEAETALYALMALIDPDTGSRATWAAHAHDMSMWEMNEICYNARSGSGACVARESGNRFKPFIGSQFISNNRAQYAVLPQMQAIDWNYASFSRADKAIVAQVGHIWGRHLTGADGEYTSGAQEAVFPIGAYDRPSIISGGISNVEGASNNFSLGHWQAMVAIGLLLDPTDDPAVSSCATSTTTICARDGSAQTVGAYSVYAIKGWLYRLNALFEDQHIVNSEYGLSDPFLCPDIKMGTINCTGSMSGGFTGEGTGYGQISMYEMFNGLYALYTAGKLNPSVDPQASFISSSFWDKLAVSWVDQLLPLIGSSGQGVYIPFGSDTNNQIFQQPTFNIMEVYDAKYGSTWRKNIDKWYSYNTQYSGPPGFYYQFLQGHIGGALYAANIMMATSANNDGDFDPTGNPAANAYDPRNVSALPVEFESLSSRGGFYRYYGRNNWSTKATQFQFGCNSAVTDHAMSACGRFDFIRDGEPLTTALGGSSNSEAFAQAPQHQNIPGYQYNPSFKCDPDASVSWGICQQGGMMDSSWAAYSSAVLATSSNSTYYYGSTDASGAHLVYIDGNSYAKSRNVTLSQREVLWLKPDQIFVYDRSSQTLGTGFQVFNLDLQVAPTISGNQATMTSRKKQKLFVTALLPKIPVLTATALDTSHENNSLVTYVLVDTATPATSMRMLHVVEGKNSGAASVTSLVQSSVGTNFDGGVIGSTLVMFKRTLTDAFSSTAYPASGARTQYITGLAPSRNYAISAAGAPASAMADSGGVLTFNTTGTGNVVVSVAAH